MWSRAFHIQEKANVERTSQDSSALSQKENIGVLFKCGGQLHGRYRAKGRRGELYRKRKEEDQSISKRSLRAWPASRRTDKERQSYLSQLGLSQADPAGPAWLSAGRGSTQVRILREESTASQQRETDPLSLP